MYNIDITDCVAGIPQTSGRLNIKIDKSDAVSPNWNTMYKMTSEPRGYCLIINNRYFTGMYSSITCKCRCLLPRVVML